MTETRVNDSLACFVDDFREARKLLLDECESRGMQVEQIPHPQAGPDGEPLAMDVAATPRKHSQLLVVSSGLHGAEAPMGTALIIDLLRRELLARAQQQRWDVLLLHSLNPFGAAHLRRWDENNVDPNRNFLLPGEPRAGASEVYLQLNSLLNPVHRPPWHDTATFYLRAAAAVARHGFAAVKQAVAQGQFERKAGLFYGGSEPGWTQRTLDEHLSRWLGDARQVVHFDLHSGLGSWGSCQLLLDYAVRPWQRAWLEQRYEPSQWSAVDPSGDAYNALGGLGKWCDHHFTANNYLYMCAEFGTYGPLRMLRALRLENQAWQSGHRPPSLASLLRERFCPRSAAWRRTVANRMWTIVESAFKRAK